MPKGEGFALVLVFWLSLWLSTPTLLEHAAPSVLSTDTRAPSFLIEAIEVSGEAQVPEAVILSESLLVVGQAYREQQLRLAMQRINRLPYVMECRFQLKRGSRRGAYRLVVDIVETRFWFVEITSNWSRSEQRADTTNLDTGLVGARWFVGASDLLYLSTESFANWRHGDFDLGEQLTLGYSHFNLFDQNILFDAQLTWSDNQSRTVVLGERPFESENGERWGVNLTASVPAGQNHWFKLVGHYETAQNQLRGPLDVGSTQTLVDVTEESGDLTLTWEFNTTDDAFVPRRGQIWQIGLRMGGDSQDVRALAQGNQVIVGENDDFAFDFRWELYRPYWNRHNMAYRVVAGARRLDRDLKNYQSDRPTQPLAVGYDRERSLELTGDAVYAVDLWGTRRTRRYGDLRLEFKQRAAFYHRSDNVRREDAVSLVRRDDHLAVSTVEIKYRNAWAIVRLRFEYLWRP